MSDFGFEGTSAEAEITVLTVFPQPARANGKRFIVWDEASLAGIVERPNPEPTLKKTPSREIDKRSPEGYFLRVQVNDYSFYGSQRKTTRRLM